MQAFITELRRRNVLRMAAFYAAAGWLLVQVATQVFPFFDIPNWAVRLVVVATMLGFVPTLLFSWFYELTPQGIKLESEVARDASITRQTGRALDRWIIALLALAVVVLMANSLVRRHDGGETASAAAADKSLAVLPLANESGDPNQEYFSDGLSEELINGLGQIRDLRVIGRSSSFHFKNSTEDSRSVGQALGVANLLEGSVRKAGDRIRIGLELVRAADGSQIWSQTYDRDLKDVFAVQEEIARTVAQELRVTLLGSAAQAKVADSTANMPAYDALLQGTYYAERRNPGDYQNAFDYFKQAIGLDPAYAPAYARLALLQQHYLNWDATKAELKPLQEQALANARRAVELAPDLTEAQVALGAVQAWTELDLRSGEQTLKKAVALAPADARANYMLADVTASLGRAAESLPLVQRAIELEPLSAVYRFYQGWYLLSLGRMDEAEAAIKRAVELQPGAETYHAYLAKAYLMRGDAQRALAEAQAEPLPYLKLATLAEIYFLQGRKAEAQQATQEFIKKYGDADHFLLVDIYAYFGDKDQAFAYLEKSWTARDAGYTTTLYDPLLKVLYGDPRFTAFCLKAGLPPPEVKS
jgi:TolB-like protein/Tfp pilus assembly protein PilF